ncbi:MAG: aminoacyl-tRNA hydrolase [Clostridia bacterium]|nr:aminoacyl-tRNA hydrolase [Clostridia bacterium]
MFARKKRLLIVGLGNPGLQYQRTRHNVGFMAIDRLAEHLKGAKETKKFEGQVWQGTLFDKDVILLKPETFMNNSGQSVAAAARFYKIPPQDIYVIFDDVSLKPGQLRIRAKGSAGGHNGLKSIITYLTSDGFMHVKVGVGAKPHPEYDLADWVLAVPGDEDKKLIDGVLDQMPDLFRSFFGESLDRTMNKFNH